MTLSPQMCIMGQEGQGKIQAVVLFLKGPFSVTGTLYNKETYLTRWQWLFLFLLKGSLHAYQGLIFYDCLFITFCILSRVLSLPVEVNVLQVQITEAEWQS